MQSRTFSFDFGMSSGEIVYGGPFVHFVFNHFFYKLGFSKMPVFFNEGSPIRYSCAFLMQVLQEVIVHVCM